MGRGEMQTFLEDGRDLTGRSPAALCLPIEEEASCAAQGALELRWECS